MTRDEIKDLMSYFDETNLNRIKIKDGGFEIELEKYEPEVVAPAPVANAAVACPAPQPINVVVNDAGVKASVPSGVTIDSPMVGSFYAAPSPGAPAFVKVGQSVKKGETVCIIEAMKIMNEIEAEFNCRITKCLVEEGQPIEYGMALFEVEKL